MTPKAATRAATCDRLQGRERFIALDGLRGAAVLLVILYHGITVSSGPVHDRLYRAATFGWVGVDLFFVLSGFLITGILCDTRHQPRYFGNFFIRRALRIFPLYYVALLVLLICLPFIDPQSGDEFRRNQGWYWSYLTNIFVSLHPYTHSAARTGHFWSLAVEEQFYLLWPVVVMLLDLRRLRIVCVIAIAAAPLLRAVLLFKLHLENIWVYTLLPTRIDALMVGALLAIAARDADTMALLERWIGRLTGAALVVVGALIYRERSFTFHDPSIQLFGYSAVCVLGGALVGGLTWSPRQSWLKTTCESPLLRWFGRYSYAGYIIHFPLMYLLLDRWKRVLGTTPLSLAGVRGRVLFTLVSLAISAGLAFLSWHVIEQPFLRLKRLFRYGS